MEFQDKDFITPALALGILALRTLNDTGPMSLDALSKSVGSAKSSLLRHLRTLEQLGLVEQRSRTEWAAKMMLVANVGLAGEQDRFRTGLMDAVSGATGLTVEWYRGVEEGMALRDQRLGGGEIQVMARPGFLRAWGEEVDAVARLGYAFDPAAPQPDGDFWRYSRNGHRREIQTATVARAVRMTRSEGAAADRAFNSNLVRRAALAIHFRGEYLGVLAVAEPFSFQASSSSDALILHIRKALDHANFIH